MKILIINPLINQPDHGFNEYIASMAGLVSPWIMVIEIELAGQTALTPQIFCESLRKLGRQ
jgi:hypothetical protein